MLTILITGATAGIGLECAMQIATPDRRIVLVGRDPAKLARAAELVTSAGAGEVDTAVGDFASLESVRRLADEIRARYDRISVLINNAGAVFAGRTETIDGIETTFAVNHLAGYVLTESLKELLIAGAPSRIVITASTVHYRGAMDFDDIGLAKGYSLMKAYAQSKLANVLYARELAAELASYGVTVNALHPGVVATDIWDGAPWYAKPVLALVKRFRMITPAEGGARLAYVAVSSEVDGVTGAYFEDNSIRTPSERALDDTAPVRLRRECDRLAGFTSG